jgi:hypothetical protein
MVHVDDTWPLAKQLNSEHTITMETYAHTASRIILLRLLQQLVIYLQVTQSPFLFYVHMSSTLLSERNVL